MTLETELSALSQLLTLSLSGVWCRPCRLTLFLRTTGRGLRLLYVLKPCAQDCRQPWESHLIRRFRPNQHCVRLFCAIVHLPCSPSHPPDLESLFFFFEGQKDKNLVFGSLHCHRSLVYGSSLLSDDSRDDDHCPSGNITSPTPSKHRTNPPSVLCSFSLPASYSAPWTHSSISHFCYPKMRGLKGLYTNPSTAL